MCNPPFRGKRVSWNTCKTLVLQFWGIRVFTLGMNSKGNVYLTFFFLIIIWLTFNFQLKVTIKAAVMGAIPGSAMVYFVY